MATQILRTVDRLHFEQPLAVLLAGAAGFAVMAMPHDLFAHVPVASGFGKQGQGAVALLAALLCGLLAWVAMRRPTKRVAVVEEEEDLDLFADAMPVPRPDVMPAAASVRLRRADRHPDAPAREPIRASRDLGEPFMDVAPLGVPARDVLIEHEPIKAKLATEPLAEPVAEASVEADPVVDTIEPATAEIDTPEVETAEQEPVAIEQPIEEDAASVEQAAVEQAPVEQAPVEQASIEWAEPVSVASEEPVSPIFEPAPLPATATPIIDGPVPAPTRLPLAGVSRRDDTSLAAMIDRLSDGMKTRGDGTPRPIEPARDRGPALRDALDELNRLAVRRG